MNGLDVLGGSLPPRPRIVHETVIGGAFEKPDGSDSHWLWWLGAGAVVGGFVLRPAAAWGMKRAKDWWVNR